MPKLSSTQLFVLALVALAFLAAIVYVDRTYIPLAISIIISVLGLAGLQHASSSGAAHVVQGINLAVPLSPTVPLTLPSPDSIPPLPTPPAVEDEKGQVP